MLPNPSLLSGEALQTARALLAHRDNSPDHAAAERRYSGDRRRSPDLMRELEAKRRLSELLVLQTTTGRTSRASSTRATAAPTYELEHLFV